jgi:mannitol-1-phosphate 5-dehydrogenase
MAGHVFTGFGFGPIQSGLFVNEAFSSGNFSRIVIAEINRILVDAVRTNNGCYYINVARSDGIKTVRIDGIEIYNPAVEQDRKVLIEALSKSTEIVTSLPSVSFYDAGSNSVASLVAQGLQNSTAGATIVYTAENNNRAAEILEEKVNSKLTKKINHSVQYLNTVIGKMSQVVNDSGEIAEKKLKTIVPGIDRAFLVEEFNKILVTKCKIENFKPGIEVFLEKEDLLPFEEAKLYGHNAIHALLAYLAAFKNYTKMKDLKTDEQIMQIARDTFINESGAALIKKYSHLGDELFTEKGYKIYAEDLLDRMTNPYLDDTVERAARDPLRKLGLNDRIFGTMSLALEYGIEPKNMVLGALAGVAYLLSRPEENGLPRDLYSKESHILSDSDIEKAVRWLWKDSRCNGGENILIDLLQQAKEKLLKLAG